MFGNHSEAQWLLMPLLFSGWEIGGGGGGGGHDRPKHKVTMSALFVGGHFAYEM